ncbi:hypothetical protein [Xanthobacter autotrophicus]
MKPVMKPVLGPAKNTTAVAASSTLAKPWIACGALLCGLGLLNPTTGTKGGNRPYQIFSQKDVETVG